MHRHGSSIEREQAHRDTHRHSLFDERRHDTRGRDGHIHTPRLIKEPLVLRVVQAGDDARNRKLRFGQQRDDQVRLVVPRGGNHHVGLGHASVAQGVGRARICEHPVSVSDRGNTQLFGHVVDQGNVVTVSEELQGNAAPDRTGSSNDDLHAHSSVLGGLAS